MKTLEKKIYHISVHEFVDMILVGGNIGVGGVSLKRMQLGTQVHTMRQQQEDKISEMPLEYIAEGISIKLQIKGRADIVDTSGQMVWIEEIKTKFGNEKKDGAIIDSHLAQCKCYCAMYTIANNCASIGARVAYVEYQSNELSKFEYTYTKDEILDWFNDKINQIVDVFEKRQDHINKRNLSATRIKFPFGEYRIGQKEMATYVYKACRNKEIKFVQAPTGVGKTIATIYPAVKAFAHEGIDKVFYLTARGTIKEIAKKAIDMMRKKGLILNSLTLTAKETICPQKVYNCHPNVCHRARGYYNRLGMALDCFKQNSHYGINEIRQLADKFSICPFELSLDIAYECDIVICDYNNTYDPRAKLKRFFDDGGEYVVLVDEAHNLVSRARDMYSGQVDNEIFTNILNKLVKSKSSKVKDVVACIKEIIAFFDLLKKDMIDRNVFSEVLDNPLDDLNEKLEKFFDLAEGLMDTSSIKSYTNGLIDTFYQAKGYMIAQSKADDNYCHYIQLDSEVIKIKMFCVDPSNRLQECHDKVESTIMFSASLTPFNYYTRLLQKQSKYSTHSLPSPFDKDNLQVMINANIPVEYKFRDKFMGQLVKSIYAFVSAKKGRHIIFFPSYGYMEKAHNMFLAMYDDIFSPKQERGMDDEARKGFVSLFDEDDAHMAAFAVLGGVFSEGIDLKGDKLIGAVIVGTGFPMINYETNIIKAYHQAQDENGIAYAYIYPGFNKVLQAVGRVIRSEQDEGAVLLIDRRFAKQEYMDLMPDWWKPVEFVDDSEDILAAIE